MCRCEPRFTVETDTEYLGEAESLHAAVDGAKQALLEGHPGPFTIYDYGKPVETWYASPQGPRVSIPPRR